MENQAQTLSSDIEDFNKSKSSSKKKPSGSSGKPVPAPFKEKYFRVTFSDKSSPNDSDDVELSVNGETLVIRRGLEVIIPERFKVCADNATYPHYTQIPGKPRKLRGHIRLYPYQLVGEATEAQFIKMKRDGNKQTRDFIKKFGFEGVPED